MRKCASTRAPAQMSLALVLRLSSVRQLSQCPSIPHGAVQSPSMSVRPATQPEASIIAWWSPPRIAETDRHLSRRINSEPPFYLFAIKAKETFLRVVLVVIYHPL
ncbi:hypothetical protein G6O67_005432 [Ophiocordyceps sinensis]|uniref:Secreted protein n=1 Tax=Ophiocordyceps sinensis TaxID=72228 RepID=A0A8H4PRQ5_9HYPO|nr:hypothetical protein G6O67_005432 [Ophiocordyceps sinensis]